MSDELMDVLFNRVPVRVLAFVYDNGEVCLTDIARETGFNWGYVGRVLAIFEEHGIVSYRGVNRRRHMYGIAPDGEELLKCIAGMVRYCRKGGPEGNREG